MAALLVTGTDPLEAARAASFRCATGDAEIYAILDGMPVDERMVFVLRHFHGARLAEAAEACETSLATVKRRLARAEARFLVAVRGQPGLAQWLEEGTRWTENKA